MARASRTDFQLRDPQPLAAPSIRGVEQTRCCVVGGGPAGAILSLLLARQGIRVLLLEAHEDFDRDFRGDTIHPAILEILDGAMAAFTRRRSSLTRQPPPPSARWPSCSPSTSPRSACTWRPSGRHWSPMA